MTSIEPSGKLSQMSSGAKRGRINRSSWKNMKTGESKPEANTLSLDDVPLPDSSSGLSHSATYNKSIKDDVRDVSNIPLPSAPAGIAHVRSARSAPLDIPLPDAPPLSSIPPPAGSPGVPLDSIPTPEPRGVNARAIPLPPSPPRIKYNPAAITQRSASPRSTPSPTNQTVSFVFKKNSARLATSSVFRASAHDESSAVKDEPKLSFMPPQMKAAKSAAQATAAAEPRKVGLDVTPVRSADGASRYDWPSEMVMKTVTSPSIQFSINPLFFNYGAWLTTRKHSQASKQLLKHLSSEKTPAIEVKGNEPVDAKTGDAEGNTEKAHHKSDKKRRGGTKTTGPGKKRSKKEKDVRSDKRKTDRRASKDTAKPATTTDVKQTTQTGGKQTVKGEKSASKRSRNDSQGSTARKAAEQVRERSPSEFDSQPVQGQSATAAASWGTSSEDEAPAKPEQTRSTRHSRGRSRRSSYSSYSYSSSGSRCSTCGEYSGYSSYSSYSRSRSRSRRHRRSNSYSSESDWSSDSGGDLTSTLRPHKHRSYPKQSGSRPTAAPTRKRRRKKRNAAKQKPGGSQPEKNAGAAAAKNKSAAKPAPKAQVSQTSKEESDELIRRIQAGADPQRMSIKDKITLFSMLTNPDYAHLRELFAAIQDNGNDILGDGLDLNSIPVPEAPTDKQVETRPAASIEEAVQLDPPPPPNSSTENGVLDVRPNIQYSAQEMMDPKFAKLMKKSRKFQDGEVDTLSSDEEAQQYEGDPNSLAPLSYVAYDVNGQLVRVAPSVSGEAEVLPLQQQQQQPVLVNQQQQVLMQPGGGLQLIQQPAAQPMMMSGLPQHMLLQQSAAQQLQLQQLALQSRLGLAGAVPRVSVGGLMPHSLQAVQGGQMLMPGTTIVRLM